MSLEAILEAIRLDGDAQVEAIERHASEQVNEILATAHSEAAEIREAAWNEAVAPASKERARVLHRARLESMRILGQRREQLVDASLEQTRAELAGLRAQRIYPDVLCRLLEEALRELAATIGETGYLRLEADPRDRDLMESMLRHMVLDTSVSYTLDSWGGVNAQSEDGRVAVANNLESRLERALPFLRRTLAAWFENGQWLTSTTATPAYAP